MANYILIGGDQKQYGPVTGEDLRLWIREGRVGPQSQVKADSDAEWRPMSQFPEFADMFAGATAGSTQSATPSLPARGLKFRLKLLVGLEALFIIITIVMSIFADSFLPAQLQSYEASVSSAPHSVFGWVVVGLGLVFVAVALTATIGLFLNWRPARALFLWTRIGVVAFSPLLGVNVEPGFEEMFDTGAVLVSGVIIGMLYFSRLKELYDKP